MRLLCEVGSARKKEYPRNHSNFGVTDSESPEGPGWPAAARRGSGEAQLDSDSGDTNAEESAAELSGAAASSLLAALVFGVTESSAN